MLGIFGDSFATHNNGCSPYKDEAWAFYLSDKLNLAFENFGYGGTSLWWSFENFLKHHENFSHIVFVHTFPHRIHHLDESLKGLQHSKDPAWISSLPNDIQHRLKPIVNVYYKELYNEQLDLFLAQKIFDEVNVICQRKNIKLVNILPFESLSYVNNYITDLTNRTGDCILGIQHVAMREVQVSSTPHATLIGGDKRYCHLTKENNQILAELIAKGLSNTEKRIYYCSEEDKDTKLFVFDRAVSDRYFYEG